MDWELLSKSVTQRIDWQERIKVFSFVSVLLVVLELGTIWMLLPK